MLRSLGVICSFIPPKARLDIRFYLAHLPAAMHPILLDLACSINSNDMRWSVNSKS